MIALFCTVNCADSYLIALSGKCVSFNLLNHQHNIRIPNDTKMEARGKLRHQRSQSEIVFSDLVKLEPLGRPQSVNQLQATSINHLYKVAGCENLPDSSLRGRPRSWTWHGTESEPDKGVFSIENDNTRSVSIKTYSQESVLEGDDEDVNGNPRKSSSAVASGLKLEKSTVKDIISDVLVTEFLNREYQSEVAAQHCALVTQRIQSAVIGMLDVDVKVVATVHLGEQKGQAVEISCQCLWDPENDNLVTVSFQDESLFAICTVFIVHA